MDNHYGNESQRPAPQAYPPAPQVVYLQPGQQVVYVQTQPGTLPVQGQGVYQQTRVQAPSSGLRLATGILGLLFGGWSTLAFAGLAIGTWMISVLAALLVFLHLIGTMGVLALGVMMIIHRRRRSKSMPMILTGASIFLLIIDITISSAVGVPIWAICAAIGCLPVIVLALCTVFREAGETARP